MLKIWTRVGMADVFEGGAKAVECSVSRTSLARQSRPLR